MFSGMHTSGGLLLLTFLAGAAGQDFDFPVPPTPPSYYPRKQPAKIAPAAPRPPKYYPSQDPLPKYYPPQNPPHSPPPEHPSPTPEKPSPPDPLLDHARQLIEEGRNIFRFDTFGSEAFWGNSLKLHLAILGHHRGGVGPGLTPRTALALGLKVDADALPHDFLDKYKKGHFNFDDPGNTLVLLQANAIVGLKGIWREHKLTSIGIQCALCHSSVDNSVAPGIGRRLDGWANRDLDVGKIICLAPNLEPFAKLLSVHEATVRKVLHAWGPGKFDAALILDGKGFRPDGKTAATLIPPAFGLAGINLHTWTGWGSVPHWNAFVANLEMKGKGTFYDPRLNDPDRFPIAAKNGFASVRHSPDLITPKLPALHLFQLSLAAPKAPPGSFDSAAARRGQALFLGKATCHRCHVPPLFTEPGHNLHTAREIGIDDFQAKRSPTGGYRTAPLKGLWTHTKGGFYHDGRFHTLHHVVHHYNNYFHLQLEEQETGDLVEYLKSL